MDKLQGQQQSIKECRTIEKKKRKKQTNKAIKKEINSLISYHQGINYQIF